MSKLASHCDFFIMYIETIKEKDCPNIIVNKCNFCGNKVLDMYPHISKDNIHICEKCTLDFAEGMIKLNNGGWKLFWLEEMKYRYFNSKKKKRNSYLPKKLRDEILKKYNFTCQNCGTKENLTIDHIKPVIKNGNNEASNLTILCKSCNSRKGAKYD